MVVKSLNVFSVSGDRALRPQVVKMGEWLLGEMSRLHIEFVASLYTIYPRQNKESGDRLTRDGGSSSPAPADHSRLLRTRQEQKNGFSVWFVFVLIFLIVDFRRSL